MVRSPDEFLSILIWTPADPGLPTERLQWFRDHLETIQDMPNLSASVFVTDPSTPQETAGSEVPSSLDRSAHHQSNADFEPHPDHEKRDVEKLEAQTRSSTIEIEDVRSGGESDGASTTSSREILPSHIGGIPVAYGRPCVSDIIRGALDQMSFGQKVLVLGCGPESLMEDVRRVSARCIKGDGPSVDLHCEQFGW